MQCLRIASGQDDLIRESAASQERTREQESCYKAESSDLLFTPALATSQIKTSPHYYFIHTRTYVCVYVCTHVYHFVASW